MPEAGTRAPVGAVEPLEGVDGPVEVVGVPHRSTRAPSRSRPRRVRRSSLRKFRLLPASQPSNPSRPIVSTGADTSSGWCRRAPSVAGHRRARSGVTGSAASTRSRSTTAGRGCDPASAEATAAATRSASPGRQRMPRRWGMEGVPKRRARWIPKAARVTTKGARPMSRSPSRTATTRVSASGGATWRHHAMSRWAREPGRRTAGRGGPSRPEELEAGLVLDELGGDLISGGPRRRGG